MIYSVTVNDEYGFPIDAYRVGAWNYEAAEHYVSTKVVKKYGVESENVSFRLAADSLSLFVLPDDILDARRDFCEQMGLDTAAPV